jgi:hypothetical protein
MSDIKALVREAWEHRQDRQSPEHKAVLAELSRNGKSLNADERGDVWNYLRWAVLDGAEETRAYRLETFEDMEGRPILQGVVYEEKFPEEIAWMKWFAQFNRLSTTIESWLARKRHAFVDEFRRDPRLMTDIGRWPGMTAGERKEFLLTVIRMRLESFNDEKFSFAMPDIKIAEDLLTVNRGSASSRQNEITLSTAVLEDETPSASLMTIYHEGTHNILTQLATAAGQELIPESHALYEDARKLLFTRHYGLAPPGEIASLYQADDEERIAAQEEEYFVRNLSKGYGLQAKFDAARFRARQSRQRNPEKLDLGALLHDLRYC